MSDILNYVLTPEEAERLRVTEKISLARLREIAEALESPREWTPCAEGLPEEGREVLFDVICDMNVYDLHGTYKGKYEDGVFWVDEYDHKSYIGAPKETVTEWMPCPKSHRADDTTGKADHIVDANKKVQEDAEC